MRVPNQGDLATAIMGAATTLCACHNKATIATVTTNTRATIAAATIGAATGRESRAAPVGSGRLYNARMPRLKEL